MIGTRWKENKRYRHRYKGKHLHEAGREHTWPYRPEETNCTVGVSNPHPISQIGSSGAHSAGFPGENFVAASQGEAGREKEREKERERERKREKEREGENERKKEREG